MIKAKVECVTGQLLVHDALQFRQGEKPPGDIQQSAST